MWITHLELRDFRSCAHWSLHPDEALTILVGPNAVGKTNIIEAIQIVTTGASFRRPEWADVVRWDERHASIAMSVIGEGTNTDVEVTISAEGARSWRVGGAVKKRAAEATRFVPVVTFTPDDLLMVKGPAEQRRTTADDLGAGLSATFGALRRDYSRVVRQRNALLREEARQTDLDPWDDQLVILGASLHMHRRRLVERVEKAASVIYGRLSGAEALTFSLVDNGGALRDVGGSDKQAVEEVLRSEITRRWPEERARKTSLVGPHRDDIVFLVNGKEARVYASQGQQRTIALAWKWAELTVVGEVLRRAPVLLLDDVMSELDESRRMALTDLMQRGIQTFVTTTNTSYFEPTLLERANVVMLGR